jgi:hypothetical protein
VAAIAHFREEFEYPYLLLKKIKRDHFVAEPLKSI